MKKNIFRQNHGRTFFIMQYSIQRFGFYSTLILTVFSCVRPHPTTVQRGFYFWQNQLSVNDLDTTFIQNIGLQRLYVRLLDVDLNAAGQAVPLAKVKIDWTAVPRHLDVVPVVYIRNQVFQSKQLNTAVFAQQLHDYILAETQASGRVFEEIQLDCDWSGATQKAYFGFILELKKAFSQTKNLLVASDSQPILTPIFSATIRLHQIKFREKTGIPPVERGVLMLYNMSEVTKNDVRNSIFDPSVSEQYLSKQKPYKLPLDVALPLFSWGVVFRNNQFTSLLNGLNREGVSKAHFLKKTDATHYEVQQDTVFRGEYLRLGDVIRLEEIPAETLNLAAEQARKMVNSDTTHVIFYHFDKNILKSYPHETLQAVYRSFL